MESALQYFVLSTVSLERASLHFFRYFRALSVMETRFPISKGRDHVQINFTWLDAIQPRKKTRQMNIHFEKAAVLFNLGAVMSQQAVSKDRGTSEGCKEACALFQVAI